MNFKPYNTPLEATSSVRSMISITLMPQEFRLDVSGFQWRSRVRSKVHSCAIKDNHQQTLSNSPVELAYYTRV